MVKPIQLMSLNDYVADLLEFVRKAQEETEIVQDDLMTLTETLPGLSGSKVNQNKAILDTTALVMESIGNIKAHAEKLSNVELCGSSVPDPIIKFIQNTLKHISEASAHADGVMQILQNVDAVIEEDKEDKEP